MVDIYLVANPLALSTLPSHAAMTALHNTLESIYNTHIPNPPSLYIPPPHLLDTFSPHTAGIYHLPPNPTHPITYPLPERMQLTYPPPEALLLGTGRTLYTHTARKKGARPP
jgi:hypothetical protein